MPAERASPQPAWGRAGGENHRFLLELMQKGATITGTESAELLLQEYQLAREMLVSLEACLPPPRAPRQSESSKTLLEKRDRFIASRISQTLRPRETGLAFLGMLHSLERLLPDDIELIRLLSADKPARHRGKGHPATRKERAGPDEPRNLAH